MRVSDFIDEIGAHKLSYVSQLLQGAAVQILYRRSNYYGSDVDYNSSAARLKTFVQLGSYDARLQKLYDLMDVVNGQPRKTKTTDKGTTVYDYFTQTMVHFPADAVKGSTATYCVNSGKRVKTSNSDEAQPNDEIMQHQTERGAQWIPACLLEIISGQIITTTLGSKHTREMIKKALRLPAGNYDLIEKEGLEIIGVKTQSGQQPLASMGFEVDKELIEVPAVTLKQPILRFANMPAPKKSNPNTKPIATTSTKTLDLGRWDLKNVEFAETPVKLGKLHMLALKNCFGTPDITSDDPKVGNATLNEVHTKFLAKIKAHGINMEQGTTESEYIILIPQKNYKLYAFAKRVADFKQRHVLFAVGSKFLQDGAQQLMSKLSLKINMKFGGASHHLHAQTLDNLFRKTPKLG
ncbi:hypothetical protein J4E91_003421 [Alternaria rosae]|nr:hypothetical protein J4E91_003421 [Alternaria rosae]